MDNRKRNNQLKIYLTDEEKEVFEKKMKLANCKTMSNFLRKCVLEKEIYVVDLEPFRNLQWLLSNATNNINQIAKATNTTGVIYKNEIESMNKQIEKLSKRYGIYIPWFLINKSKVSNINKNQASNTLAEETFNEEENFYDFSDLKNITENDVTYEKSKDGKTLNNYKVAIINKNNEGNFEYKHLIKNYKTEVDGVEYSGDLELHHTSSRDNNKDLIMVGYYTGDLTAK